MMPNDILDTAIEAQRKDIRSDSYPISIGEFAALYQDGDLNMYPKFQRFFRWSIEQKTALIESVLLGIPIPSIFVSQSKEGKWEVIDGLQRLSSIFEFMGILQDSEGNTKPPISLVSGRILKGLQGASWAESESGSFILSEESKRIIKRAKLNVTIILRESTNTAKFEMFNRINSGGSPLTAQELRNCQMVMLNEDLFDQLEGIVSKYKLPEFFGLSDAKSEQSFALELLCRWLAFHDDQSLSFQIDGVPYDVTDYITARVTDLWRKEGDEPARALETLDRLLKKLNELAPETPFQAFNVKRSFQLGVFEAVFIGGTSRPEAFCSLTESKWQTLLDHIAKNFQQFPLGGGTRGTTRIPQVIRWGRDAISGIE